MKNYYPYINVLFALLMIYSCASYGPKNKELPEVLSTTEQVLASLADKIPVTEDEVLKNTYLQLVNKYQELAPALKKCNEKYALTVNYMITLREAQKALQRVDKDFNTLTDKAFILDAIYRDYDAKLQSINSSPKSDANTKIKVLVNSNEDEGFFVFGKLSYEQGLDIKRFRFNRPTQNASQDFVPGYYLFWLEKEDLVGEPELHLIMDDGTEGEKQLVLKTPK
ncbi:hypothetical protein GCM10022393_41870 [Aquimarina addita]|uniref:Gliding motility-associated protein GldM N-terminal domain-containing protein n=1 Tax=Aquimarina addita TaxID=870485 RepID=A0ABP6UY11_9FLAO